MADGTVTETGLERIESAFEAANEEGRAALMPYLMGGFPDQETRRPWRPLTPMRAPT